MIRPDGDESPSPITKLDVKVDIYSNILLYFEIHYQYIAKLEISTQYY